MREIVPPSDRESAPGACRRRSGVCDRGVVLRALRHCLLVVLLLFGAAGGVAACGPSEVVRDYAAFRTQVDGPMQKEDALFNRFLQYQQELDDDPRGTRYYPFLETTALPFYAGWEKGLTASVPATEPVRAAHTALVRFVEARRELMTAELRRREHMRHAPALLALRDRQNAAAAAHVRYMELVGDDVPDPRLAEILALDSRLQKEFMEPAVASAKELAQVDEELRMRVLPALARMREGRFGDDERQRALRALVNLQDDAMQSLAETLPVVLTLSRSLRDASRLHGEAEERRTEFQKALQAAERAK